MTLENIKEIEIELQRFGKRLKNAKNRIIKNDMVLLTGCKETGALKRATSDLKAELTKLL